MKPAPISARHAMPLALKAITKPITIHTSVENIQTYEFTVFVRNNHKFD